MWRPLVRFGLLGLALFVADRSFSREPAAPVVVSASRVAAVRAELASWQREPPSAEALLRALEPEIEEELLYREALRRGYDRGDPVVYRRLVQNLRFAGADPERDDLSLYEEARALGLQQSDVVVRRRLVQRMRLDLEAAAMAEAPSDSALRAHYEAERERYRSPARATFRQLFFGEARRADAERVADALRSEGAGQDAQPPGVDAFLHPAEQPSQSRDELAERFGAGFADRVFAAEVGAWSGPLASAYGHHLVFVRQREPARTLAFESVRERVRFSWLAEARARALREGVAALRAAAEVRIEGLPEALPDAS